MTLAAFQPLALLGNILAIVITLMVLLYALGDNPLFRLAIHVFIGVSAGYAAGVAWHSVIRPQLIDPLLSLGTLEIGLPEIALRLLLIALLLTKLSPRTAVLGNPITALLVGVGAAVAVGGAILGTIFPLAGGSAVFFRIETLRLALQGSDPDSLLTAFELIFLEGAVILIGTIATLIYFHFGARNLPNLPNERHRLIEMIAKVGKAFIAITFGALFAGVYIAALNALIERLFFIWDFVSALLL